MATTQTIHTHGYQHFENLQLSAQDFYKLVEEMIKSYQYPNIKCDIEELKEGGLLSAKRKYLSIKWQRHKYLICASPFGKSFFISWWHEEGANTGANIASKFGVLGRAVATNMENKSYFEADNELMFISCINAIIEASISKVKADHGFKTEPAILAN